MRVADAEPIAGDGLDGQRCYRLIRAGGRSAVHEGMRAPLKMGSGFAAEFAIMAPGGPHDSSEFVGESNGGLVVPAPLLKL